MVESSTRYHVLLFAGLVESCGCRSVEIVLPCGSTVAELQAAASAVLPPLAGASYRVAVNSSYAHADAVLEEHAEIAFLPPVSGG